MGQKIAVVGAGPAGIYAVDALLKQLPDAEIDLFEQAPAPYGLVRYGVAPDHQKIKSVTKAFAKTLGSDRVELFANVNIGTDITVPALRDAYDVLLFTTGCADRRPLGIPGEDMAGYHGAPQFVAWYNGHPNFTEYRPNLHTRSAVVVGAGNVSMDVARMLLLDYETLSKTDVPDYALAEFRTNEVRDVHVLIRRGPEQAAFDLKEIRDIIQMENVSVVVRKEDLPDPIPEPLPAAVKAKLKLLAEQVQEKVPTEGHRMFLHFFRSPIEILGDERGVQQVKVEHTALDEQGRARGTGEVSVLEAGLVVSAAGYRGTALEGVPFDMRSGTVPNQDGRVVDAAGKPIPGLYVAGWIKRGPSGVIGTNKACAVDTVKLIVEDLQAAPAATGKPGRTAVAEALQNKGVRRISWADWLKLDGLETERGAAKGKVREKFTSAADCLTALGVA